MCAGCMLSLALAALACGEAMALPEYIRDCRKGMKQEVNR